MPVHASYKKMINSMGKTYKTGKVECKKLSDGSQVCVSEKAWSVFFGWLNKHNKKETEALAVGGEAVQAITPKIFATKKNTKRCEEFSGLTDEDLHYNHAKAHAEFAELGDEACKVHFKIANEMIRRGIPHIERTNCDIVVSLSINLDKLDISTENDKEKLKTKLKACKVMLFRLSQGVPFESGVFKGMSLEEQKHMIKVFMRKLKRMIGKIDGMIIEDIPRE